MYSEVRHEIWKMDRQLPILIAAFLILMVAGEVSLRAQTTNAEKTSATTALIRVSETKNDNYRIGPGDVIDIVVNKNEALSRSGVRVNNQGTIQLTMMDGEMRAACLTEKELADQIKERYKKYLLKPFVLVSVKEFNSTPITLIGAINSPKQFQLQRPMRLFEVLTLGSGPSAKAGETVQIIRNPEAHNCQQMTAVTTEEEEGSDQLTTYELAKILKGDEESNPFVQTGDVIRVLEAEEVKQVQAYIIGNVKSAQTIDLREPVTLTQAIAMAGGTSTGAQIDKIKITSQVPGTLNKSQQIVNLKEVNRRNEGDILLKPNDIIEVPGPTGSKKFLRDVFKSILPAMTRFPLPLL